MVITKVFAQILFAVTFTFARMGGGPYLAYVTLAASNPFVIKVCYCALHSGESINLFGCNFLELMCVLCVA